MAGMEFARKCAVVGALVALAWAAYVAYFELRTLDLHAGSQIETAKNFIKEAKTVAPHMKAIAALHVVVIALHLPVMLSLRFNLRKQDDVFASLGFYCTMLYVAFAVFTEFAQLHMLPRLIDYFVITMHRTYPTPLPREFVVYFSGFTGSLTFMTAMIGHLFYAASMATFAWMVAGREQTLAVLMALACAAAVLTFAAMSRGFELATFGLFALGVLQAGVLFNIARRFKKVLQKRDYY